MSLTSIAFLIVFALFIAASLLRNPIYGVIGYYVTYIISPATRWWGESLAEMGVRFSYIMAAAAILSLAIHFKKLKPTNSGISMQEVFLWLFVASIWIAGMMNPQIAGGENQALKLTKAALMLFVLKRSIDDFPKYRWVVWALLIASFYGAFDTRLLANRIGGRIQSGSGGSDFLEGNFLAAHLSMLLPFLGVFFICGRWKTRIFLVCAAAIMVDVIVQCRSRGAFLAIIVGAGAALLFAPAGTRKKIYPLILLGALGAFALVDIGFWDRMSKINSIATEEEEDKSSTGRLLAWRAALSMASDHPLGIGFNNFKVRVGNYQPSIPGKDTHNTYLRCLSELGVQGLLFLALLIWNAMRQTYRLHKRREPEPDSSNYALIAWATGIALVIYLSAGMFISLTYVEDFYLLLMLPDALSKHRRSEMIEQGPELADISEARTDV